jgi:hypothetical protein
MKTGDGFGSTWLTNWRRAADVPRRTLVFTFAGTTAGVALVDYFVSGRESVWLSIALGIACGVIVTLLAYRRMATYEPGDRR